MAEKDGGLGPDKLGHPDEKDKCDVVESSDGEGSAHVSDDALTDGVSADVAPVVGEFMEQAAAQNEAAAEEIPEIRNKPGSYISFEHV